MTQKLAMIALLVDDYDRALAYFVDKLGFEKKDDKRLSAAKRWVTVVPPGATSGLLLARAANERQREAIGNQSGGRVFLFLETDNFERDHEKYLQMGVKFVEPPREESYGEVAVFEDI